MAVINTMTKKLGEERVYLAYISMSQSIIKGINPEHKLREQPRCRADAEAMEECCYWSLPHGLLSLLYYRTQDPELEPLTAVWAFPYLPSIKKMSQSLAHRPA